MEVDVQQSRRGFGAVDLAVESGRIVMGSFVGELFERFAAICSKLPLYATIEEEG